MKLANAEWVVLDEHGWHCMRCDRRYRMAEPVLLDVYLAAMQAFAVAHAGCIVFGPQPKPAGWRVPFKKRALRRLVTLARERAHLIDGTSLGLWMAVCELERP